VPIDHVVAIYARENGQGMAFPAPDVQTAMGPVDIAAVSPVQPSAESRPAVAPLRSVKLAPVQESAPSEAKPALAEASHQASPADGDEPDATPPSSGRPSLKRIK
jgi:stringent starvation protein B